jgi:hypothetical protein
MLPGPFFLISGEQVEKDGGEMEHAYCQNEEMPDRMAEPDRFYYARLFILPAFALDDVYHSTWIIFNYVPKMR